MAGGARPKVVTGEHRAFVYALVDGGVVRYIGRTMRGSVRPVSTPHTGRDGLSVNSEVVMWGLPSREASVRFERESIAAIRPERNRQHVPRGSTGVVLNSVSRLYAMADTAGATWVGRWQIRRMRVQLPPGWLEELMAEVDAERARERVAEIRVEIGKLQAEMAALEAAPKVSA